MTECDSFEDAMADTKTIFPLRVLVCDDYYAARTFKSSLHAFAPLVEHVEITSNLISAGELARQANTIFIDPLTLGLDESAQFIFDTRRLHPDIVFVLHTDLNAAESHREEFYRGERHRFTHYYTLNKRQSDEEYADELQAMLQRCQVYLKNRVAAAQINNLREIANDMSANISSGVPVRTTDEMVAESLELLRSMSKNLQHSIAESKPKERTVFLSYRFAEDEYVRGLTKLLEREGFMVVTGKNANSYIGRAVINRIRESEYFLCLMTKDKEKTDGTFTTSPWLLEEKGVALAMEKRIVLMVEEGISESDVGGLQGDWQRIHFTPRRFTEAALEAVDQLKSYSGSK